MNRLQEVHIEPHSLDRLYALIDAERRHALREAIARGLRRFSGQSILSVNSTATGGGVAEILPSLLGYLRGAGLDAQWVVIAGTPPFFAITKRLHNALHGSAGDGGALGDAEHAIYEEVMGRNAGELSTLVSPGDLVVLHDPQTAGLVEPLKRVGARVVWRCHIGLDRSDERCDEGWEFLRPYLADVDAFVFSRASYAPPWVDRAHLHVIPPSIDPFSPKNADLTPDQIRSILSFSGIVDSDAKEAPRFLRADGTTGRMDRHADVLQTGPPPHPSAPLVAQISRWDRLKDMPGVMRAFADHVGISGDVHLLLAGPNVSGVVDDPEGAEVLTSCMREWGRLPHGVRSRVHLACLPTADVDENAVLVNAIQRHASVVTQKSLAEGFGLTVSEAMWKGRAVVASGVGGIVDQIEDGKSGVLIDDPTDLGAFGAAVMRLLEDPDEASRLGAAAVARTREQFLTDRHLLQFAALTESLA